ncbi:MAG: hypothetical protein ACK4S2_10110 [Gemmobacter sp.]|uniref:hypothetical protein n=1 Tax=Gemmobacter sp. TaxID=1898957 RepID=UPI00391B0B66
MNRLVLSAALALFSAPVLAQSVPTEVQRLGPAQVTLHLHPFLTPEEQATLRLVASNEQALALFVPRPGRHAAIAVAPDEGFIRAGQPVASATAMSDLPDAEAARAAALQGCEGARKQGAACVVVLEVAPFR